MQFKIETGNYTNECIIAIANAISRDIDSLVACSDSLDQIQYDELRASYNKSFNELCAVLESRGVVISDHVVCPHE